MIPRGAPVLCTVAGTLPVYGRALPGAYAAGLLRVRLTADHGRAPKGAVLYVLAKNVRQYRRGRHASGVRTWGPAWLRMWRKRR